jgi:hypothetical protein
MRNEQLDRILSRIGSEKEEIIPSSGFTASVMDAVRREATTPPPIPFPWKRALPGLAAGCVTLVLVLIEIVTHLDRHAAAREIHPATASAFDPILNEAINAGMGWIFLVLLLSLVSMMFSMRLTSGRFQQSD